MSASKALEKALKIDVTETQASGQPVIPKPRANLVMEKQILNENRSLVTE